MINAGKLINFGAQNVLIKGGHRKAYYAEDIFISKELKVFKNKKIKTNNTHGTGCTLSSAIATCYRVENL